MELNPQQILFLASYTNPKSETFGNALQSALKAGYTREYSESLTAQMPDWLSENLGKTKQLKKAEDNLEEVQNLNIKDDEGKIVGEILRERTKVDLFIAETVGKANYSKRSELTGKDGQDLTINVIKYKEDNNDTV